MIPYFLLLDAFPPCRCLHLIHSKVLITSRIHNHPKIFNKNIKYLHVKDYQTEWITSVTLLEIVHLERAWIVPGHKIVCSWMNAAGMVWMRPQGGFHSSCPWLLCGAWGWLGARCISSRMGQGPGVFAQPPSPCSAERKVTISDRRRPGVQA